MALNIRGIQPLAWGTVVTTGYLTESIGEDDKTDQTIINDEGGNPAIEITGYGIKADVTLEVIPKASVGTPPVPGQVFGYGASGSQTLITILAISKKQVNKDVVKWTIKGDYFPNITLTIGS